MSKLIRLGAEQRIGEIVHLKDAEITVEDKMVDRLARLGIPFKVLAERVVRTPPAGVVKAVGKVETATVEGEAMPKAKPGLFRGFNGSKKE